MKKSLLCIALACLGFFYAHTQTAPKREVRGAWIATYANIDWPTRTQTPAQQQAALRTILDHHQATGINTIFLQVRSQCDALYQSSIEPWSADLTGTQGKNPLWDPLQFAIDECRNRGMELQAWINPYRAIANYAQINSFTPSHVARQHPEWLIASGTLRTLDPGLPEVRDYITTVITDLVQRYDIAGIHFDDYFYPNAAFNDDSTFRIHARGFTDRGEWRRDNVNLLIERLNTTIHNLKPWVKFGVSPSGIYRNSTNPEIGTPTTGLQHHTTLYADTRKWIQNGWVDYLAPQVYWYMGQPGADYSKIVPWWNNNAFGRHMYIGLAGYKVADPAQGANWANPAQIPNEVRLNRSLPNIYGQAVYNTTSLRNNKLGFRDSLRLHFYATPSLRPSMPWRDATAPAAPTSLTAVKYGNDSVVLNWSAPAAATNELDKVTQYVIYRSKNAAIDTTNAENILAITTTATTKFIDKTIAPGTTYYYTVTAVDRLHNESANTNPADNLPPRITCPAVQPLFVDGSCAVTVPDYRTLATVVSSAGAITLTQLPAPGTLLNGAGNFPVTLTATDAGGNAASCSFIVTTLDTIAPVITDVMVNPSVLMVPNHKMRDVAVQYTATDNCGPVTTQLTVASNEPVNGTGDGDTIPDWEIMDNHQVRLRAERSGTGSGRVYTITITATDAAGNVSTRNVTVTVPHHTTAPVTTTAGKGTAGGDLVVKAVSNPTVNQFVLQVQSPSNEPLTIKVTDNWGRVVEMRNGVAPNSTFYVGSTYRPGVYILEAAQGAVVTTLKLVKQPG